MDVEVSLLSLMIVIVAGELGLTGYGFFGGSFFSPCSNILLLYYLLLLSGGGKVWEEWSVCLSIHLVSLCLAS